ncbi:MAG TPA: FHA domain-containing protein [Candidatus Brocadiia bacterium]|nr:FHA domain-containing protein [Candidatus Brocadiia bacterium]
MAGLNQKVPIRITVQQPDGRKRQIQILAGKKIVFGRHPDADVFVRDSMMSREHFEVDRIGDRLCLVRDMTSQNGTFVNDRRIWAPRALNDGDRIKAGDTVFLVAVGPNAILEKEDPDNFQALFRRVNQNDPAAWLVLMAWCKREKMTWELDFCKTHYEMISQKIGKRKRSAEVETSVFLPRIDDSLLQEFEDDSDETVVVKPSFGGLLETHGLTQCEKCRGEGRIGFHEGICWGTGVRLDKIFIPPDPTIEQATQSMTDAERDQLYLLAKMCIVTSVVGAEHLFNVPARMRGHILTLEFLRDCMTRYAKQFLEEHGVARSKECVNELLEMTAKGNLEDFQELLKMVEMVQGLDFNQFRNLRKQQREVIEKSNILRAILFPDDPEMAQIDHLEKIGLPNDETLKAAMAKLPEEKSSELGQLARLAMIATLLRPNVIFRFSSEVRGLILTIPVLRDNMERLAGKVLKRLALPDRNNECRAEVLQMLALSTGRDFARMNAMVEKISSLDPKQLDGLSRKDMEVIATSKLLQTAVICRAEKDMLAPPTPPRQKAIQDDDIDFGMT